MEKLEEEPEAAAVVDCLLQRYARLPKKGKPNASEWTVLAGFVAVHSHLDHPVALALGTGTKCLPATATAPHLVSDCHAEVVARRALCLRLLEGPIQLSKNVNLWLDEERSRWNPQVRLWMYTSKEPCGSSRSVIAEETENKRVKVDLSVAIRKPGKGPATNCLSCADKISKWLTLGILSQRHPVSPPLTGLVVGGKFEHQEVFKNMLESRHCPPCLIVCSGREFFHEEKDGYHPSGLSLNWLQGEAQCEVLQGNGKKMGANNSAEIINPKHISRLAAVHRKTDCQGYQERKKALSWCFL
jgi:hypothetical protein